MTAHSKLGASSSHRWMNCPGSVALSEGMESKSSFAAAEGTAAHAIAADVLHGMPSPPVDSVVEQDDFSIPVTQEMLNAVALYAGEVIGVKGFPLVEQKFDLSAYHPALFGTADAVVWQKKPRLLHVFDFKYGAGVPVEVQGNPQLKYYALGALIACGYPARRVRVTIVQPRCPHPDGPVRSDEFDAIDLLDFGADLKEAAIATEKPNAPLAVGEWCRWCPAAGKCPAQRDHAQALAKVAFADVAKLPPDPRGLTLPQIGQIMDRLPIFEAWAKSVREYAYEEAEKGNPVPGYKLVDKVAHRKLKDDASPHMLASVADCDVAMLYAEPKLKGVPELEKLMPGKNAKERAAALAPFVVRESTGHVLVHESDKRPAVDPQAAAKLVFQPIEAE